MVHLEPVPAALEVLRDEALFSRTSTTETTSAAWSRTKNDSAELCVKPMVKSVVNAV